MNICKALVKYGYSNFSLTILEYCSPSKCLEREDFYIKKLNPKYNISQDPTAPMSGRKHSDETKIIMSDAHKGKTLSDETKKQISDSMTGENNPMFGKNHTEESKTKISDAMIGNTNAKNQPNSQIIEVTDITNNTTVSYNSMREAARALNLPSYKSISTYIKNNQGGAGCAQKPYKGRYTFKNIQI